MIVLDGWYKYWNESGAHIISRMPKPIKDDIKNHLDNPIINSYYTRTIQHIDTVQHFGSLFNLDFSKHDMSKLYDASEGASYLRFTTSKISDYKLSHEDILRFLSASKHHVRSNHHHPEFWIRIELMPLKSIIEMVCDWYAMSIESGFGKNDIKHGDTKEFFYSKALGKYNFTEKQQKLILDTIGRIDKKYNRKQVEKIWTR